MKTILYVLMVTILITGCIRNFDSEEEPFYNVNVSKIEQNNQQNSSIRDFKTDPAPYNCRKLKNEEDCLKS